MRIICGNKLTDLDLDGLRGETQSAPPADRYRPDRYRPREEQRKSVQFDLEPAASEELERGDMEPSREPRRGGVASSSQSHVHGREMEGRRSRSADDATPPRHSWRYDTRPEIYHTRRRHYSPPSDDSGETVLLPDRFDRQGRQTATRGQEPLVVALEDLLSGRGVAGQLFHRIAGFGNDGRTSRRYRE